MSRSIARFLSGTVKTLTRPLSRRQQRRTIARVIDNLTNDSLSVINTERGSINLYGLKSAYAASAVERFHTDEPETLSFIDRIQDGEILWDIGANIGIYSLYAGLRPGITVFAFEPSGFNFGLLVEHIALNGMGNNIKPYCIALGDSTEINELNMTNIEQGHAGNALGESKNQFENFRTVFTQSIPAFTIDDFIEQFHLSAPDYIKLDVDGIEPKILAGATKTLPAVKAILVEVEGNNAEHADTLIEPQLKNAGFSEDLSVRNSGSGRNRLYINN
ncbi:MAG: FkbM family methyltransferase, partial [Gammaproteobacteria bacterium]|nr:FkbM family methyltransferase [Gammaproteobacteria bacterium]